MQKRHIFFLLTVGVFAGVFGSMVFPPSVRPVVPESRSVGRHIGAWVRAGYYDPLFEAVASQKVLGGQKAVAAIVNHHLFAPDLIATTLHEISNARPSIIVLISPNHFGIGMGSFITSAENWMTMSGGIAGAPELARTLENSGYVSIDESIFEKEHGVSNDVAFVRHYFPDAKLLPLVVREQATAADVERMADLLDNLLPPDGLVLGSFDFSHGKKDAVAKVNDAVSIRVLEQLDAGRTSGLDIDSTKGLQLLLRFARLRSATTFHLVGHSSSAERIGDQETTENTSYITGFFSAP